MYSQNFAYQKRALLMAQRRAEYNRGFRAIGILIGVVFGALLGWYIAS